MNLRLLVSFMVVSTSLPLSPPAFIKSHMSSLPSSLQPTSVYTCIHSSSNKTLSGLPFHLARLAQSTALQRSINNLPPLPVEIISQTTAATLLTLNQLPPHPNPHTMVTILWQSPTPDTLTSHVHTTPLSPPPPATTIILSPTLASRSTPSTCALSKHCSWLNSRAPYDSLKEIKTPLPLADIIMCDSAGDPLEGLTSNLFAISNGTLYTRLGDDVLNGYVRDVILNHFKDVRMLTREILTRSDEVFVTNSGSGVRQIGIVMDSNKDVLWTATEMHNDVLAKVRTCLLL